MAKYIEREAILDLLKNKYQDMSAMPASYYKGFQYALKTIERIKPAADVAPVVRCKECKHWKPSGSKAGNSFSDMEYIGGCEFANYCRRESDFCSYGERKEGAE